MAKQGGGGLNFKTKVDISESKARLLELKKLISDVGGISMSDTPTKNFTQANDQMNKSLRNSMLETERLRRDNISLQNQWQKGAISLQELTLKQKANTAERQDAIRASKEARKAQEQVNGSYLAAQARLKALGLEIKGQENGFKRLTPALKAKVREYNELNASLTRFDEKMGNHQRKVGKYENALNGLKGLTATYLGGAAILAGGAQIINANAEISDSLSDVRRTAGLTAIEAENLAEQLKKIDTRTSLKGLLEIATIGGQLGIAKDQLSGFTTAVDQLAVSLAGELEGGAEGIAKSLGVLDNVFGVTKSNAGDVEKSFNQIGSAILGLGQSGLATGDFLTDFGERVGGLAKQAGLSLPVILSYGAVLQENGVSAEVAGSSFKRLLAAMTTNRAKFLSVAQIADASLTLEDFTNIINTDAKKALDLFFAGLTKGGTTTTSFNDILKSLRLSGVGVSQSVAALAGHQESLNGHIEQATKDFNEASLSAEQFALKNDNLAGSLEKFSNTITKITTSGRITAMFKGIVDGATNALDKFNNLVNSGSWKEFWTRLTTSNSVGNDIVNLTKSFADVSKNNAANQQFIFGDGEFNPDKLKDLGEQSFNKYLDRVKKTYDTALDSYANYAASVKNGRIKEQGATVAQYKFEAQRAESYYKQLSDLQTKFGYGPKKVTTKKDAPTTIPEIVSDKEQREVNSAIKARNTLQQRIDELIDKSTRKQLASDEAEVESVRAKYKAMREDAEQFNNDPRNKKAGVRVSGGKLNAAETSEVQVTYDKQANARLKNQLADQTKDFEAFENYKIKYGQEAAQKRYGSELTTAENYLQKLEELQTKLLSSGDPADFGEAKKEELAIVTNEIIAFTEKRKSIDDGYLAEAFQAAKTHAQELTAIEQDYQRKKLALGESATEEQLSNLAREKDERIRVANEANAFAKSGYAELMMQYDELTRGEIKRRLEAQKEYYRAQYKAGLLTAEQLAESIDRLNGDIDNLGSNNSFNNIAEKVKRYREQINTLGKDSAGAKEAQDEMYAAIAEGAADASTVISSLAASFQELGIGGEGLQDTLKNIGGVVDGIGGIAEGLASGNPVDVVTGSIKLLTSAINLFNVKDKKLEKQIKGYQAQLDSLGKSYKQLERDVNNAVGNDIYTDQAAQIENLKRQQQELIKMRNAENDKKKSDASKVKEFQDQIDSIPGQIDDINKAISQNLIQGTFRDLSNSLSDALSEAFKTGEDGIASMDNAFNGFIANAIKNSLKLTLLEPVVADFTRELTEYAKKNGNSIVGFDFDKWREQLKDAGELFNAGLKGSEDFFKEIVEETVPEPKKGISGTIVGEAVTEGTANRMLGLNQGIYDLTKQNGMTMSDMLQVGRANLVALEKIAVNTARGADNTTGIGEKLDKIVTNTTPKTVTSDPLGQALRDAGIPG